MESRGAGEVDGKTYAIPGGGHASRGINHARNLTESQIKPNAASTAKGKGQGASWGVAVKERSAEPSCGQVRNPSKGWRIEMEGKRIREAMVDGDLVFCIQKAIWRGCKCHKAAAYNK